MEEGERGHGRDDCIWVRRLYVFAARKSTCSASTGMGCCFCWAYMSWEDGVDGLVISRCMHCFASPTQFEVPACFQA